MAYVNIRGHRVDVDIERELSMFEWSRAKWSADKLTACSPFRYDSQPSFYVYLVDTATATAGSWGDSGGSGEYRKGGIVKLLAFLRGETEHETENYLLSEYAREVTEEDTLEVDFSLLKIEERSTGLPESLLDQYDAPNYYLRNRGISAPVEAEIGVRYDPRQNRIAIPWRFPNGKLANIKYRHCDSKIFYYEEHGHPIRELIFGLDRIFAGNIRKAVLVEAEIDAMYIESVTDLAAIASGTCRLTEEKAELIARSPLEEIVVLADNDVAGEELERQAVGMLSPYVKIKIASLPDGYKDANDVRDIELLGRVLKCVVDVGGCRLTYTR